jgi:hypothetical protein
MRCSPRKRARASLLKGPMPLIATLALLLAASAATASGSYCLRTGGQ